MGLCEEILAADPALARALLDKRRFAPKSGREGIVNIELFDISQLTVEFQKARSLEHAEALQRRIRGKWFLVRSHCDGYFSKLPAGHDDGCEHVQAFARAPADFGVDRRARAALWYRHAQRPPPPWL